MKILLSIIFLFAITNLQADLIIKRKKNFNSCQEVYETGHFKGDGFYKIRKDNTLQDIKCKEDIQLKEEYSYYNGVAGQTLNWEDTNHSCGIDNNENRVAIFHGAYTCQATARTNIFYSSKDVIEVEFDIQRLSYGSVYHNQFDVFGMLSYQYLRGQYERVEIKGSDFFDINSLDNNTIKIIKNKNKYSYYLNNQLISEKIYDLENNNNSNFLAQSNNSNIRIANINIKIYKNIYVEDSN